MGEQRRRLGWLLAAPSSCWYHQSCAVGHWRRRASHTAARTSLADLDGPSVRESGPEGEMGALQREREATTTPVLQYA